MGQNQHVSPCVMCSGRHTSPSVVFPSRQEDLASNHREHRTNPAEGQVTEGEASKTVFSSPVLHTSMPIRSGDKVQNGSVYSWPHPGSWVAKVHFLPYSQVRPESVLLPPLCRVLLTALGQKGTLACWAAAPSWPPGGPDPAPDLFPAGPVTIGEHVPSLDGVFSICSLSILAKLVVLKLWPHIKICWGP